MSTDGLRPEEKEFIDKAERLDGLLATGGDWARRCLAPAQWRAFLEKSLNGKRATVRKIQASARRPIALGVFGASQCRKSFLISELVKGDHKRPLEVFTNPAGAPPAPRDYLDHINPPGGRESAALAKAMPTHYSLAFLLDRDRFAPSEKAVAAIYDAILNPMLDESGPPAPAPRRRRLSGRISSTPKPSPSRHPHGPSLARPSPLPARARA